LQGFPVVIEIEPRFRDTDAMGHLNHVVYITYFEVARAEYWARLTGSRAYDRAPFILAHVAADYRSPAYVREKLRVGIRMARLGTSSFDAEYRIEEASSGRLVVEGRSVQVGYDYERQQTVPLSAEVKGQLRAFEGRGDL
jgi:acyl-CoA thioester hydrolase